jgi:hypothetical protein
MRTDVLPRDTKRYKLITLLQVGFDIVLFLAFWTSASDGFRHFHQQKTIKSLSQALENKSRGCEYRFMHLFSSDADENENKWSDGTEITPLEAMRRLLESSWNVDKMGRVPLDATEGANEVYSALLEAFSVVGDESGIYMVELLSPTYDISQGERMYDEVCSFHLGSLPMWVAKFTVEDGLIELRSSHFSGYGSGILRCSCQMSSGEN